MVNYFKHLVQDFLTFIWARKLTLVGFYALFKRLRGQKTCSRLKTQQSLHKYVNILNNVLLVIRLYTPNYMHFNHLSQLPQIHGHQYQNPVEVNPLQDRLNLNSVEYTVCETQPYLD